MQRLRHILIFLLFQSSISLVICQNTYRKLSTDALLPQELQKITYTIKIVSYGEKGYHVEQKQTTPFCGIRFGNGILLGGDRGEWGGELAYQDEEGVIHILVEENTHAIYKMPFGVVAITGLTHLWTSYGCLYLISINEEGNPIANRWETLPGAAAKSGILENGNLFISCHGGDVLVTPSGEFKKVE